MQRVSQSEGEMLCMQQHVATSSIAQRSAAQRSALIEASAAASLMDDLRISMIRSAALATRLTHVVGVRMRMSTVSCDAVSASHVTLQRRVELIVSETDADRAVPSDVNLPCSCAFRLSISHDASVIIRPNVELKQDFRDTGSH